MPRLKRKAAPYNLAPVVPPQAINIFKLPAYMPKQVVPVRPGADDHKRVKSRGLRT